MDRINFIYLRSVIGDNNDFKDAERAKFLKKFNSSNDFVLCPEGREIFFIETGGTEEQFRSIYLDHKEPYYLLATNANNSLPAALEIATFLKKNHKKFKLFHGTQSEIRKQIKTDKNCKITENLHSFSKIKALSCMRLGVIGKPSDWLIASDVDYSEAKEKLGIELIDIKSEELLNKLGKINGSKHLSKFSKFLNKNVNKETLVNALKIYEAIKQIISEYKLDGITIRCFDLLGTVHNTSCLALAMLNEEGYIATCEGDVPTMITMAFVRKLFNQSSFQVNPSYVNLSKRYAYFAHCTLPLDMCESYKFDTHFESGIGIGIKGKMKEENITIFRINGNLNDYEIFEGKIVKNLSRNNLCRTQIKVSFDKDIKELINNPNGNHLVIFYGHHKQELSKILSY